MPYFCLLLQLCLLHVPFDGWWLDDASTSDGDMSHHWTLSLWAILFHFLLEKGYLTHPAPQTHSSLVQFPL